MAVDNNVSTTFAESLQTRTLTKNETKSGGNEALGKDAFLQLLVTQMKNQNPLEPQDNGEFVAQLAQFSSLESMQNLTSTVDSIATIYKSSQALQASSLVGRSVQVETSNASFDPVKGLTGSVVVLTPSSGTTVKVYDANNALVDTLDLGDLSAGTQSFTWDGVKDDGTVAAAGTYTFEVSGMVENKNTALSTILPSTISSVTTGVNGSETMLNLAGGGSVALSKVQTIGL